MELSIVDLLHDDVYLKIFDREFNKLPYWSMLKLSEFIPEKKEIENLDVDHPLFTLNMVGLASEMLAIALASDYQTKYKKVTAGDKLTVQHGDTTIWGVTDAIADNTIVELSTRKINSDRDLAYIAHYVYLARCNDLEINQVHLVYLDYNNLTISYSVRNFRHEVILKSINKYLKRKRSICRCC